MTVQMLSEGTTTRTSQEIADFCELDYLQVARRMSDLVIDGKVQDSGQTRRSPGGRRATVWKLSRAPCSRTFTVP